MNLDELLQQLTGIKSGALMIQLMFFILWCILILFLVWLIQKGISRAIADNTARYHARKATRLAGYFLILLLAVVSFTGKVQYFGISIGLLSAGIAFALQEVILSAAGWISIFSANLYKPGDRIELNKVKGDVIDIGITRTTLMEIGQWVSSDNYTGRIVQISNAYVFKEPVYNYSRDFPFLWDEITLPVRYGSDVELTKKIIKSAATETIGDFQAFAEKNWEAMVNKYLIENAVVEPTISIRLTDNWMDFTLRYVVDYKRRRINKSVLYNKMLESIGQSEGKVQLASATYELVGMPEVKINTGNPGG